MENTKGKKCSASTLMFFLNFVQRKNILFFM